MDRSSRSRSAQAHLIKAGRLKLGLTQREVARRLGVHEQTIAAFERGRKQATGDELIGRMAALFGYDWDEFYYVARRIPPDMHAFIRCSPRLMGKIRQLMAQHGSSGF